MKKLRYGLMIQSLSPLAVLTIIRNFSFEKPNMNEYTFSEFWKLNQVLIVVFILCLMWIAGAVIAYISFSAFKWTDKKQNYDIKNIEEKEDASLNFFLTMIIPLLIDNVGTIQGAITFACIVILMWLLLARTNLFYANPVLAILGYRIYEFVFDSNSEFEGQVCIGIAKKKIKKNEAIIEYKKVPDTSVFYIKEM